MWQWLLPVCWQFVSWAAVCVSLCSFLPIWVLSLIVPPNTILPDYVLIKQSSPLVKPTVLMELISQMFSVILFVLICLSCAPALLHTSGKTLALCGGIPFYYKDNQNDPLSYEKIPKLWRSALILESWEYIHIYFWLPFFVGRGGRGLFLHSVKWEKWH